MSERHYLLDHVLVLQVLQETDFPDCGRWDTVILLFESDLFDGNEFSSLQVLGLVDNTISSLTELLKLLILVELGDWLVEPLRHDLIASLLCCSVHLFVFL